jgi:hypothetical protein
VDKTRDVAWSKIPVLKKWLPHYDYVMWVDMDAFFMRYDIAIESMIRDESKDVILTKDWHGVNFGVFIFKNAPSTMELMELMWGSPRHWWEPWQEQSALMKLLDRRYVGKARADELDRHVLFVAQRDMNSYPQHFAYGNMQALYLDGDFIAHFPNCKAFPMCRGMMDRFFTAACMFNGVPVNMEKHPGAVRPSVDPAKNADWAPQDGNAKAAAAGSATTMPPGAPPTPAPDDDLEPAPTPAPAPKKKKKKKTAAPTTQAPAEDEEEDDAPTTPAPRAKKKPKKPVVDFDAAEG